MPERSILNALSIPFLHDRSKWWWAPVLRGYLVIAVSLAAWGYRSSKHGGPPSMAIPNPQPSLLVRQPEIPVAIEALTHRPACLFTTPGRWDSALG